MSDKKDGPTDAEILAGKARVEVIHANGKPEIVDVLALPVRQINRYLEIEGNAAQCAELFAGKKEGWADTLRNESVYRIVETGERLNESGFQSHLRFLEGRRVRVGAVVSGTNPSPVSSPESASKQD